MSDGGEAEREVRRLTEGTCKQRSEEGRAHAQSCFGKELLVDGSVGREGWPQDWRGLSRGVWREVGRWSGGAGRALWEGPWFCSADCLSQSRGCLSVL